jgi:hypothetical protein
MVLTRSLSMLENISTLILLEHRNPDRKRPEPSLPLALAIPLLSLYDAKASRPLAHPLESRLALIMLSFDV